jgi:hypothetical protein
VEQRGGFGDQLPLACADQDRRDVCAPGESVIDVPDGSRVVSPRISPGRSESPREQSFRDGPGRDRTCDLGIKSPLLYQLSYRPVGQGQCRRKIRFATRLR